MTDIVLDIRDHLLVLAPHERDSRAAWQLRVAADEIERLRALADRRGEIAVNRRREIERLRTAIRRLAEQDATLSVVSGNVIVEMDPTLTVAEVEAVRWAVSAARNVEHPAEDTLRGLLARCAVGHQ